MAKVAESMDNPSWIELVQECNKRGVDLTTKHMYVVESYSVIPLLTALFLERQLMLTTLVSCLII